MAQDAVRVQVQDFSVEAELAALKRTTTRMGAIAVFVGCARDFSAGRSVVAITFEQYAPMAREVLATLREEALARFDVLEARIVHRVARVLPGENIILVAVGAQHRAPAFAACGWLMDEIKRRVPIWKREETPEGARWVAPGS